MLFYSKKISLVAFIICFGLLCFAAYLQYSLHLQPCPLCVIQRICVAILGLIFMVGALYIPRSKSMRWFFSLILVLFSGLGAVTAIRHIWLQHQPPGTVATCSASLDYMLQNFPITQTLMQLLNGSGDCAQVTWQLLHLSIPEWTLIFFVLFLFFGLLRLTRS